MMKCELCKVGAKAFCESDQANLCWTCDAKVHSANFLVERHSRTLLCRACNSLTPWKATGAALANAVSVCNPCAIREQQEEDRESEGGNDVVETDTEDNEDEQDGDNQVVPWSPSTPPPLTAESSSGSDESVNGDGTTASTTATSVKRQRENGGGFERFGFSTEVRYRMEREGGGARRRTAVTVEHPTAVEVGTRSSTTT